MLVRVETFEGGTADGIRAAAEQLRANSARARRPGSRAAAG